MTHQPNSGINHAERYQTALAMAAYCDQHQFSLVNCEEHHCAQNGWLPSPLTLAAAIAGGTRNIGINITALLITLYDPIRLAEDIAVIDNISQGRFNFVAGLGYRPEEYHAVGKDWAHRGQLMDECIETLLKAWADEPFIYKGQSVNVTPKPTTKPHPFFFVGGMSRAAAKRAAKFGLPFYPPMAMPELEACYHNELAKHGNTGFVYYPKQGNAMTFIHPDPEQAWQQYAPYFLNETQEYASWKRDGVPRPSEDNAQSIDELKQQKRFEILTPSQCVEVIKDGRQTLVFHPLVGGLPLDEAWRSLHLFVDKVLPKL